MNLTQNPHSLALGRAVGPLAVALALASLGLVRAATVAEESPEPNAMAVAVAEESAEPNAVAVAVAEADAEGGPAEQKKIVIERVEPADTAPAGKRKAVTWLGVGTEEPSDTLTSQLDLPPGQGLVVTYVAKDSGAARAGLQKHDLLVQFDGQLLVHPAQLRKLIQMHKDGDNVALELFRAGKKQTVKVTLGKSPSRFGSFRDERSWQGDMRELQNQLKDMHSHSMDEGMKALHESLAKAGLDRDTIRVEVRRSIEDARRAAETALREASNQLHGASDNVKILQDLARSGVNLDKDSTVVVRRKGSSVQTQVKSDDTGTYVIVATPKKRLTAHDAKGKLLFDGDIDTPEQQKKVPKDVWTKVEPMVKQMDDNDTDTSKDEN